MAKIDKEITNLFHTINEQQADLEVRSEILTRPWVTTCSLSREHSKPLNIQTAGIEDLVKAYAALVLSDESRTDAAAALGVENPLELRDRFTVEQWKQDFCKRIDIIRFREDQAKLNDLEMRLDAIVSPEQRRQLELEAIAAELK